MKDRRRHSLDGALIACVLATGLWITIPCEAATGNGDAQTETSSGDIQATPLSPEPYYPMLLSNGSDAVLVSYWGSMVAGLTGHSHFEQHQGVPCAWYKVAHAAHMSSKIIQPIVESGYQIIVDGEVCEPEDYAQRFDPRRAVLTTRVRARGVVCEIESFLTNDQMLVEEYRVLEAPEGGATMAFFVKTAFERMGAMTPMSPCRVEFSKSTASQLPFSYELAGIRGRGALLTDAGGGTAYDAAPGFRFQTVKAGWRAAKFLVLKDISDGEDYEAQLDKVASQCQSEGIAGLKRRHEAQWTAFSDRSRITLPDKRLQYLYETSLYAVRASQHRPTGAITCGMLPNLWGGGTCTPYDAGYSQQALLASNHVEEAGDLVRFYETQRPEAKKIAGDMHVDGAVYSGWADCRGNHKGSPMKDYLHYKPLMPGYIALSCYWQWYADPSEETARRWLPMMKEILDLAVASFIDDKDDVAYMRPCMAGNESAVEVENDTFNGLVYARALAAYAEMARHIDGPMAGQYAALSKRLYAGVFQNYRDGMLMPYRGATYHATLQFDFYLLNLPEGIDRRSIYECLRSSQTPWGLDTVQPSERYRDWPWLGARAAIALAHLGDHQEAFAQLQRLGRHASALGAMPEKIRMDGYPIGYWYTTCHGLVASAVAAALCHDGPESDLRLLWGLDGSWKDTAFSDLRMKGGILVSAETRNGSLVGLTLRNAGPDVQKRILRLNPAYGQLTQTEVTLPPGETLTVHCQN